MHELECRDKSGGQFLQAAFSLLSQRLPRPTASGDLPGRRGLDWPREVDLGIARICSKGGADPSSLGGGWGRSRLKERGGAGGGRCGCEGSLSPAEMGMKAQEPLPTLLWALHS